MTGPLSCPTCGAAAPADATFCSRCGARLRSVLSPGATRKLATIVFCDLVGSTSLGERLDPEALRHVQLRYFETCEQALVRYGGTVEKFIGDAVLSVFGTPTVREDDAVRACRAALDLGASIDDLNDELEGEWGVRLSVRMGVNTGLVVAGDPSRGQILVTGDAVNTAARLEQVANPGEILIGPTTRELLGEGGTCVLVPPLTLKGKAEQVQAWRLLGVGFPPPEAILPAAGRPLVGRDDELRQIDSWLAGASAETAGGICAIVGAPGVGKSRLLLELSARTSCRVLWGRCVPYGEGIAYAPLADWLGALGEELVERTVGATDAERLRFAVEQGDQPATGDEIAHAARLLTSRLGASEKLLLVLEDLHWAEPAMVALLGSLVRVAGVSAVATTRPEATRVVSSLCIEATDLRLELRPLGHDAAADLLRELAPDVPVGHREHLLAVAEGNPLMIVQLARHIAEGGDPARLPPGLEAVLQARIASLSHEERAVAERGAVMGREFWDVGVAALAPEASSPTAAIGLLVNRDFVVEGRADGAPDIGIPPTLSRVFEQVARPYSFTHSLLRDAVYQATPMLRRADLHERLARLLEDGKAPDELVAFHLERAARLRRELRPQDGKPLAAEAVVHLERARERAAARHDEAAEHALVSRAAALGDAGGTSARVTGKDSAARTPTQGGMLVPGDVFAGYRIRAIAARGGMGVVYRADDLTLGRPVALKVIVPNLAGDAAFRERFARETRVAARLEHPCVVPVYRAGEEQGQLFIAMRFVEGTDLAALVRGGALPPERAPPWWPRWRRPSTPPTPAGWCTATSSPATSCSTGAGDGRARLPHRLRADDRADAATAERSPRPGSGWARSPTSRPSRSAATASTRAPTSTPWGPCSTSASRVGCPSRSRASSRRSAPIWTSLRRGRASRARRRRSTG